MQAPRFPPRSRRLAALLSWAAAAVLAAAALAIPLSAPAAAAGPGDGNAVLTAADGPEQIRAAIRSTPKARLYSRLRWIYYGVVALASLGALALIARSGWSGRVRDLAESRARTGLGRAAIFFPLQLLSYAVPLLPLHWLGSYLLPHWFGLSNYTPAGWMLDWSKSRLVTILLGIPAVAFIYWLLRVRPQLWWLFLWVTLIPITAAGAWLTPLVLDPLYHRFEPLPEGPLRRRILALAADAGIEGARVFRMDASRRTRALNAYVTGLGGSARIVLWDTLLDRLPEDQVVAVTAHEIGHYVEQHVLIGVSLATAGSLLILFLVDQIGRRVLDRRRWGIRGINDLAGLPVLILIVQCLNLVGDPLQNGISRVFERQADAFALRLTGDGPAQARAMVSLGRANLSDPDPPAPIVWWLYSHPPLRSRVEHALSVAGVSPAAGGPGGATGAGG